MRLPPVVEWYRWMMSSAYSMGHSTIIKTSTALTNNCLAYISYGLFVENLHWLCIYLCKPDHYIVTYWNFFFHMIHVSVCTTSSIQGGIRNIWTTTLIILAAAEFASDHALGFMLLTGDMEQRSQRKCFPEPVSIWSKSKDKWDFNNLVPELEFKFLNSNFFKFDHNFKWFAF